MMRSIVLLFLSVPLWATSYTSTSACATSCNLSARASWTPDPGAGNYPGMTASNHDAIVVSTGYTVVVDAAAYLGSNAGNVGHAFTVQATNSTTYGKLQVASGVTLTLAGNDRTTNTMGLVSRYAHFEPLAGSTVLLDPASEMQSVILNNGVFLADATGGAQIYIATTPACYSWNNTSASEAHARLIPYFDNARSSYVLDFPNVSNAAGTGPGSFGDSSLSISAVTGGGTFTAPGTEVSTLAQVTSADTYWVNYDVGYLVYYGLPASVTITLTYKYLLVARGAGIWSTAATTYNSFVARNVFFQYIGDFAGTSYFGLDIQNKTSYGSDPTQGVEITHCKFRNYMHLIRMHLVNGTASYPTLISYNDIGSNANVHGTNNQAWFFTLYLVNWGVSYITFTGNTVNVRNNLIQVQPSSGLANFLTHPLSNWTITNNSGFAAGLISVFSIFVPLPDILISGNTISSAGSVVSGNEYNGMDTAPINDVGGALGHPAQITNNTFMYGERGIRLAPYLTVANNSFAWFKHHTIMGTAPTNVYCPQVWIHDNAFWGYMTTYDTPAIMLSYTRSQWMDNPIVEHNVSLQTLGFLAWGDTVDQTAVGDPMYSLISEGVSRNNIAMLESMTTVSSGAEVKPPLVTGTTGNTQFQQIQQDGPNWYYGNYRNFLGYTRGGAFTQNGVAYNTSATRNATGVDLWNPSYTSLPSTNHTLVLTKASATNITLALDSGAAQQIVWPSSGTSYTVDVACSQGGSTSPCTSTTVPGQSAMVRAQGSPGWSNAYQNAACPGAMWLVMTSGSAAGEVHMINLVAAAGNLLTVIPDWTVVPASGDTFSIYAVQFTLSDGAGNTIEAAVDPRYLPATAATYTDAGIAVADPDFVGTDPKLANGDNPNLGYGFWPTLLSFWCAGSDGESAGLQMCRIMKAVLAGLNQ